MSDAKMGRPSIYTQSLAECVCAELSEGKGLRKICAADDMPSRTTVLRWLREREDFRSQYALAKEFAVEALADEILDIADDGTNDFSEDDEGNLKFNSENVQRSRLRIDSRKWLLAKLMPRKYGDKIDMNHGIQPDDPLAALLRQVQGTTIGPAAHVHPTTET